MTATLDKEGKILIPKKLRDKLNLKAGAKVKIQAVDDGLNISQVESEPSVKIKYVQGLPVIMGGKNVDVVKALQADREDREEQLLAPFLRGKH